MATSKREPPNPRDNPRDRSIRMSPSSKPSEPSYGPRKARSVPGSPDRKFSSSPPSSSPDYRSSLSFASRSTSSRLTLSSATPIHGKTQHPPTSSTSRPTLMRGKSDKSTSLRPPALLTPSASYKDVRGPKSPSTLQKSKLSPRPSTEKALSSKPSTQKAVPGALRGGRAHTASSTRTAYASSKRRSEAANSVSSKARSAPELRESSGTRKEQEEEPSLEFEDSESISTPSIEEHLHEQLPDPIDLKPVDVTTYIYAQNYQHDPSFQLLPGGASMDLQSKNAELKNLVSEGEPKTESTEEFEVWENADGGTKNEEHIADAVEPEQVDKMAVIENVATKVKMEIVRRPEVVQGWKKDDPKSNDVIEETRSKLLEERKSRVKALVGAFETVMSFRKNEPESDKGDEGKPEQHSG